MEYYLLNLDGEQMLVILHLISASATNACKVQITGEYLKISIPLGKGVIKSVGEEYQVVRRERDFRQSEKKLKVKKGKREAISSITLRLWEECQLGDKGRETKNFGRKSKF